MREPISIDSFRLTEKDDATKSFQGSFYNQYLETRRLDAYCRWSGTEEQARHYFIRGNHESGTIPFYGNGETHDI